MKPCFLFSLGHYSKQVGDEGDLPTDVSFVHPLDLSLADHVHHLVSLEPPFCRFDGNDAHARLHQPFQESASCRDEYKTDTARNLARPLFHHIEAEPERETVLAKSHDV